MTCRSMGLKDFINMLEFTPKALEFRERFKAQKDLIISVFEVVFKKFLVWDHAQHGQGFTHPL